MSRVPTNTNLADRDETLAKSQIGIPQEFERKESEHAMTFGADFGEQCDESDDISDDGEHG